ncbi:1,6-anhydro-N-acetylmuramyl-L-alanine amidase AmpD [Alteromonas ponticola]|uniref:1,6-anhydro-N-acetylmuramyl-L-alanine amidase AmpD n=1 Tax=Alteromonas aquimaris TaxID=2998417 RepID=A0ABT3P3F4_9ALTE|nr:1,6-anhydro-N-acetylmuramyl-L-alanine amidase AmpD [Alteromonas aquimaris]MCW8107085.1 1,6-anhydro-N-acetylmuramyl-L-alanine amidase AmpD [Alteromonas aquimaris]
MPYDYYKSATQKHSPYYDERPKDIDISLLVIHNISLPPGQFGGEHIEALFTGTLNPDAHPFFKDIAHLKVSAHCVIRRSGDVEQYVPFSKRAWHAGISSFQGVSRCNDYAIGIEMEGTDTTPFTSEQYTSLAALTNDIIRHYPAITLGRIVGHSDIACGRKTDPGEAFNWGQFRQSVSQGK